MIHQSGHTRNPPILGYTLSNLIHVDSRYVSFDQHFRYLLQLWYHCVQFQRLHQMDPVSVPWHWFAQSRLIWVCYLILSCSALLVVFNISEMANMFRTSHLCQNPSNKVKWGPLGVSWYTIYNGNTFRHFFVQHDIAWLTLPSEYIRGYSFKPVQSNWLPLKQAEIFSECNYSCSTVTCSFW